MQTGYGKRQWLPLETADTSGDPELSATRKTLRQLTTKRDFSVYKAVTEVGFSLRLYGGVLDKSGGSPLCCNTSEGICAWTVYWNSENYRSACQFGSVEHYL